MRNQIKKIQKNIC